jgi:hypothetical protein
MPVRVLIAYLLLVAVLAAAVTLIVWTRRNSHQAKYLRRMKRERIAREAAALTE